MAWTEERLALLTKLWGEGLSATQIANRLGGTTRNAVIGVVHRKGLPGRAVTSRRRRDHPRRLQTKARDRTEAQRAFNRRDHLTPAQKAALAVEGTAQKQAKAEPDIVIPISERKSLAQLDGCDCRWPMGDPREADFHFCGKAKVHGLSYCEFHARRAFAAPHPAIALPPPVPISAQPATVARPYQDREREADAGLDRVLVR